MASMVDIDNLGKRYRLGGQDRYYKTLRESLMRRLARPFADVSGGACGANEFWALRNASAEIGEGEVVGVIGRNGAGKSTLLKLLSRITRPTEGQARLFGRVGSLLEVGTGFHPELTGRENIYLSGNLLGMTRAEVRAKFDEIVAFAEVETFLDTPVKHYSSGMYVRLGFAIAAHLEPEILLIDEVLAVGDAQFQRKCLGKMDEVARAGRTILFVSHNMDAIQRLCSRCLWIDGGTLRADGPAAETVSTYLQSLTEMQGIVHAPQASAHTRPDAAVTIEEIRLLDTAGRSTACIAVDEQPRIALRCDSQADLTSCDLRLVLFDARRVRVLALDSRYLNRTFPLSAGAQWVECQLGEAIALAPGAYSVNASIRVNGQIQCHYQDALAFQIRPDGYFDAEAFPMSDLPVAFRRFSWIVAGTEPSA